VIRPGANRRPTATAVDPDDSVAAAYGQAYRRGGRTPATMVRDPSARGEDSEPDPGAVFRALADEDGRTILRTLEEPMTASQISESCDIPLSTTYRKLELLTDAGLLTESTRIREDGQHTTVYSVAFDSVTVDLDEENAVSVEISEPERGRERRLAELWSEVREEA